MITLLIFLSIIFVVLPGCDDPQSSNPYSGDLRILSPADGAKVSEHVRINFTLPGVGTAKIVELWVDNLPDTSDQTYPFSIEWSTAPFENQTSHTLFLRVYYAENRMMDSKKITVTIDNSASYPLKPRIVSLKYEDRSFYLRWVRNEEEDFFAYYLYESFGPDMSAPVVYGPLTSRFTTTKIIPDVEEQIRYYQVVTRDIFGLESYSDVVKGDGLSRILFISDRDQNKEIYEMSSQGSDIVNLSNSFEDEIYAQYLNGLEKILYVSEINGEADVFIMSPDGTNQYNLTNHPGLDIEPAVSADNQWIAFTSKRGNNLDIYRIDIEGNNLQRVTSHSANEYTAQFLATDNILMFVTDRHGQEDIYTVQADGSNERRLTNAEADDRYPQLYPDGKKVLFISDRDGNDNLYSMKIDGSDQIRLTNLPGDEVNPRFSKSGNKIVFQYNNKASSQVYLMNSDGTNPTGLTAGSASDEVPLFSIYDTYIFFQSRRDGNAEIYRMNFDGTHQINLTRSSAADLLPNLFDMRRRISE